MISSIINAVMSDTGSSKQTAGPKGLERQRQANPWLIESLAVRIRRLGTTIISVISGCAVLLATMLPLMTAAPRTAKADSGLSACFEALSSEDLVKAGLVAANPQFLQCTSQAAGGDVVMIAVIAAMTGIMAAGAFDSQASCEKVVDSVIASVMIDVFKGLESAIDLSSLFGSDFVNSLNGDLASTGIQALRTALAPIFSYIDCGCAVAGTIAEEAHLLKQYLQSVAGCAGFLLDVGKEAVKVVGDIAKGVGSFFKQAGELAACVATFGLWCPGSGGAERDPYDMACTNGTGNLFTCGAGQQCATVDKAHSMVVTGAIDGDTWNGCASCAGIPFAEANSRVGCSCQRNFSAQSDGHYGLAGCSCSGQFELASIGGQTACVCSQSGAVDNGAGGCKVCTGNSAPNFFKTGCSQCNRFERASDDHSTCQSCGAGMGMGEDGQCISLACPSGQHHAISFNWYNFKNSCSCDTDGEIAYNGVCAKPVSCGPGQMHDATTNTCKNNCPDGQIYDAGYHCSGEFCDPSKNIAPSCTVCTGPNAYVSNNTCQTVTCAGYQAVNDNHTCSNICPPNMVHASNAAAIFGMEGGAKSGGDAGKSGGQGGGQGGLSGLGLAIESGGAGSFNERGGAGPVAAYNSCSVCAGKDDVVFQNKCMSCPAGTKRGEGNSCVSVCSDPQAYDEASNSCVTCKPGTVATTVTATTGGSGESQSKTYSFCAADPNGVPSCKANEFIINDVCTACAPGQKASADGGSCEAACGPGQVFVEVGFGGGAIPGPINPYSGQVTPEGNLPRGSVFLCQGCGNPSDTVVNNQCVSAQTRRPRVTKAGDPTGWKAVDLSPYGLTATQKTFVTIVPAGVAIGARLLGSGQAGTGATVPANNDPLRRRPMFPFGNETFTTDGGGPRTGRESAGYTTETPGARPDGGSAKQGMGVSDPAGGGTAGRGRTARQPSDTGAYGSGTLGAKPDEPPAGAGPARTRQPGNQGGPYSSSTLGAEPDGGSGQQGPGGKSGKTYKLSPGDQDKLLGSGKGRTNGGGSSGYSSSTLGAEPDGGSTQHGAGGKSGKTYKLSPGDQDKLLGSGKGRTNGGGSSGYSSSTLGAEPGGGSTQQGAGGKSGNTYKLDPDHQNNYKGSGKGATTGAGVGSGSQQNRPVLQSRPTLNSPAANTPQVRARLPETKQAAPSIASTGAAGPQKAILPGARPTLTPTANPNRPTLQRSTIPSTLSTPSGPTGGSNAGPPWKRAQ